jgi:hypothetical protein
MLQIEGYGWSPYLLRTNNNRSGGPKVTDFTDRDPDPENGFSQGPAFYPTFSN